LPADGLFGPRPPPAGPGAGPCAAFPGGFAAFLRPRRCRSRRLRLSRVLLPRLSSSNRPTQALADREHQPQRHRADQAAGEHRDSVTAVFGERRLNRLSLGLAQPGCQADRQLWPATPPAQQSGRSAAQPGTRFSRGAPCYRLPRYCGADVASSAESFSPGPRDETVISCGHLDQAGLAEVAEQRVDRERVGADRFAI